MIMVQLEQIVADTPTVPTKSPPVWPSEPGYGGAKISGDPVQSVCSQGVLAVPLLASILRSWHRGSWN